jgi:hypothetical protein
MNLGRNIRGKKKFPVAIREMNSAVNFTAEERAELIGALSRTADMVAGLLDGLDILRVALEAGRIQSRASAVAELILDGGVFSPRGASLSDAVMRVVSTLSLGMADERFRALSDVDLADIWYALSGADIRHPDCFKPLADATMKELEARKGATVSTFLDDRFARFRGSDKPEDEAANAKATERCDPDS